MSLKYEWLMWRFSVGGQIDVSMGGLAVAVVATGVYRTCAILVDDGSLKCWGNNNYGGLGDGTTTDRLTPVSSPAVLNVKTTAAQKCETCVSLNSRLENDKEEEEGKLYRDVEP